MEDYQCTDMHSPSLPQRLFFPPFRHPLRVLRLDRGGVHIDPGYDREGLRGDCEELRRACLHKEELGKEGEGNCRRYRETCKDPD